MHTKSFSKKGEKEDFLDLEQMNNLISAKIPLQDDPTLQNYSSSTWFMVHVGTKNQTPLAWAMIVV